jgi:hypothetical protein
MCDTCDRYVAPPSLVLVSLNRPAQLEYCILPTKSLLEKMRAPYLAHFFNIEPKRKGDAEQRLRDQGAKRLRQSPADSTTNHEPVIASKEEDTLGDEENDQDKLLDKDDVEEAASLQMAAEQENLMDPSRLSIGAAAINSSNDSEKAASYPHLSLLTKQRMTTLTAMELPGSSEHRVFIESILKQHALFVAETCKTFQSDPFAMQTALKAHQQCIESLLELYYRMHMPDSCVERASALFQENYKQLQQLHQATKARSMIASSQLNLNAGKRDFSTRQTFDLHSSALLSAGWTK